MQRVLVIALLAWASFTQAQSLERASPPCDADLQERAIQGVDAGDPKQIYLLARYLSTGKCMPGDGKRAVQLYLQAAKLHYPPAFYNLGIIAAANQDFASADAKFVEGTGLGHRGCELQLGILYSLVPRPVGDDRKAFAWLNLTESRHESASSEAAELLKKVRERLTSQQIAQAEALASKLKVDFGGVPAFVQ